MSETLPKGPEDIAPMPKPEAASARGDSIVKQTKQGVANMLSNLQSRPTGTDVAYQNVRLAHEEYFDAMERGTPLDRDVFVSMTGGSEAGTAENIAKASRLLKEASGPGTTVPRDQVLIGARLLTVGPTYLSEAPASFRNHVVALSKAAYQFPQCFPYRTR